MFTDFLLDAGACVLGVTAVSAADKVIKNKAKKRVVRELDESGNPVDTMVQAVKNVMGSKQVVAAES